MKAETTLNKLKDCYMFAHLTYCLFSATCLIGWLRSTEMRLAHGYNLIWIACMLAILSLIPAQHKIISKTFYSDYKNLHLYKTVYTAVICIIYLPIINGIFAETGLSILTIVPVILCAIVCGTAYGIATAVVVSISVMYKSFAGNGFDTHVFTEKVLLLALLATTAWFIGQSFEYIKNLYQQLLASEKHLKRTLDNLDIATLHVNSSGQIINANKCFENLVGKEITDCMSLDEIVKKHLPFLGNDPGVFINAENEPGPVFGQAINAAGSLIPVQCTVYPVSSGLEEGRGLLICIHDISLSQKLEKEKIITSYFIDFINAGIIITDAGGNIIEMNRQAEHLLNVSKQKTINNNLAPMLCRLAGEEPDTVIKPNYEMELGDKALLVNCAELLDKNNRLIGIVCIINDITERKEIERKMQRSATLSAIGELAAGTAHEIRNPLTAIRGFLQFIKNKKEEKIKDLGDFFDIVLSEVDRINNILVEFLKLARQDKFKMETLNLNEIIDSLWEILSNEALLKEVRMYRSMESQLPPLRGNADLIKQVIINLVNNAVQAVGPEGTVRVITSAHRGGARLIVEDDGPGIEKDILPRIFDPYFTTRDEGTGLGLAITSKIVSDHNAFIGVSSSPGKGARFYVDFPPVEVG